MPPHPRRDKGVFGINQDEGVPLKRFGRAEEVANAVLFFAPDQSSFATGRVSSVSGGRIMV